MAHDPADDRDHAGDGDRAGIDKLVEAHAQAMRLLWGRHEPPRRGPKPRLTLDQIVAAAIALADEAGLDALSMRRVARRLDVGTMSLYRYVPSKEALLDLMFDAVCGEEPISPEPEPGKWRAFLEWEARESRALYRRHPWMMQISSTRPTLGPNVMAGYEAELAALDGIGLTEQEMVAVANLIDSFVRGVAQAAVTAAATERDSPITDEQWWEAIFPVMEEVMDAERFPVNARVAEAGAYEDDGEQPFSDFSFEFGLARLLDGIEALITRRGAD
jgi:AcrR family transcriptional regulator